MHIKSNRGFHKCVHPPIHWTFIMHKVQKVTIFKGNQKDDLLSTKKGDVFV
ncbi:hypothetical protein HFZ78_00105 [Priestia megaterium]|uniref:Uncharacterized protein n=1 Tax=Priestia megaterium TaxID=1404 RepID=A0A6H1NVS4_PRIMG|nr:hypothetical protein [Priestia megaterium]QIZ05366.1 hypothetical protein HFZ78_00105 [Priestia megaterium]